MQRALQILWWNEAADAAFSAPDRTVMRIVEETQYRFRIDRTGAMRVPGIVFAARSLLPAAEGDEAPDRKSVV